MRRLVSVWLALLAAFWLTRAAVSSLLFGRVDQGYPALVELLLIPALQAMALAWATREPGSLQLALPWREGWRLRPLRGILAVDLGVVAVAWLVPASLCPSWLAPSLGGGLPGWIAAAKLLAAAALLGIALRRPEWEVRDRLAVAAVAAALLALAAEPWGGWLAALPGLLAPIPSPALRWFAAYGALLAAALLLALQAESALRRHSRAAALALGWALGLLLAASASAVLGFAGRPAQAAAPWSRAAASLGSLAGTALLVGGALTVSAGRPAAARAGAIRGAPAQEADVGTLPVRSGRREPGGKPI
jgi:hypothetical protein